MNHPIVIPLHHAGGKLRDNTELRFAIRSLCAHFKDGFTLAIVGHGLPGWLEGAEHIASNQGLKTALKDAAERFPDGFFWWYDDLTLLKDQTGAEMKVTPACKGWGKAQTGWSRSLNKIKDRLVKEGFRAWDYSRPHGPYWFDKSMVDEGFRDWPGMKSKFPWESWILSKRDWPRRFGVVKQYYGAFHGAPGDHSVFLNYNDKGNNAQLREWLQGRFPEPCRFEKGAVAEPEPESEAAAAKVRFRIKGETDGPVFQGQKIVKKCGGCGKKPAPKIEVHTIRFGDAWWVDFCGRTLDQWCGRHRHKLRIWKQEDINPEYPAAKFCEVDMLREFLAGDSQWMLYVDADVYVSADAPAMFDLPADGGFLIHDDNIVKLNRNWATWCRNRWDDMADVCRGWKYKNAGVWACDRNAAEQMLAVIEEPYHARVQEQHHWNWWICLAHSRGMPVHDIGVQWNSYAWRKEKAAFHHIAGKNKARKVNDLRQAGLIPMEKTEEPFTKAFDFEPFRFALCGTMMPMDEMHIQMLHRAATLDIGKPKNEVVAVEIGSYRGASTAALIQALNDGRIGHLHIIEPKPTDALRKVMSMADDPSRITLHRKPSWEIDLKEADFVFIDGDHKWPAVADTLRAITWGASVIAMHDSQSWPGIVGTWGAKMGASMLKEMKGRAYLEDNQKREGMMTHRGFLVSVSEGIDLSPLT